MSIDMTDRTAVERRLWDEIERHQIGMLGVVGAQSHMQPMTAFVEPDREQIWFGALTEKAADAFQLQSHYETDRLNIIKNRHSLRQNM